MKLRMKTIKTKTPYFIIRRFKDELVYTEFENAIEMEHAEEDICVSMGEEGKKDNIIYESYNTRVV